MKASGYVVVVNCNHDDVLVGLYEDSDAGRAAAIARMHEVASDPEKAMRSSGGHSTKRPEQVSEPTGVRVFKGLGTEFQRVDWVEVAAEAPA